MSDQTITCSECGGSFVFTESERAFYVTKGLAVPPKRCKACRQARKAADGAGGGAPRGRGRSGEGGRGPGLSSDGRPPRFRDGDARPPAGRFDRPRAPSSDARPPYRAPRAGGGWGKMGDGALRARGNSDGVGAGGDHAPRPYGERPAPDAAGGRRQVFDAPRARRPKRPREVASASPPVADASSAPAKSKKSKNGKKGGAKFDVTCVECGAAAQVPFKPIEGRDIYCQPCYQARRLVAPAPKTDPMLEVAAPPAEVDAVEEGSTRRTPERA